MQLPKGATVAVAHGEKFNLFHNAGDETDLKLTPLADDKVDAAHQGATPDRMGVRPTPTADKTRKMASPPGS